MEIAERLRECRKQNILSGASVAFPLVLNSTGLVTLAIELFVQQTNLSIMLLSEAFGLGKVLLLLRLQFLFLDSKQSKIPAKRFGILLDPLQIMLKAGDCLSNVILL